KRWIENENELLAFLIDAMKELPLSVQQMLDQDPNKSLLAFSPTHAFLCKPGWGLFKQGWESDTYTYTWIRDYWVAPQKKFLDSILLDVRMMDLLIHKFLNVIPPGYRPVAKNVLRGFDYGMSPPDFREKVLKALSYERWLQQGRLLAHFGEELDS